MAKIKQYQYRVIAVTIKTPYQELIDHIIKEESNGWKLFSIHAVVGVPCNYLITLYKD